MAVVATGMERLYEADEREYRSMVIPDGNRKGTLICQMSPQDAQLLRSMIHQFWWYNEDIVAALDRRIKELS